MCDVGHVPCLCGGAGPGRGAGALYYRLLLTRAREFKISQKKILSGSNMDLSWTVPQPLSAEVRPTDLYYPLAPPATSRHHLTIASSYVPRDRG